MEIVAIQDERDRLTTEMDEMLAAAEAGEIPKAEAIERSHRWQEREAALRSKVTDLYARGHRSKCL